MLEVPGMTEAALRALTPNAVATLRWGLYAKALAPSISSDIDGALEAIADADRPPSKATVASRRAVQREELFQAKVAQGQMRAILFLDDESPDDDVEVA